MKVGKQVNKKRKVLLIIIIAILVLGAFLVYLLFNFENVPKQTVKKVDEIKGFNYHLEDRDTALYKKEFQNLKTNLESKEIDYEEYAKSIAKMFVIDLYTIDNKVNKYDIGSLEFVHPDAKENFELNAKDTLYKYVMDNSYNDRTQELPIVSSITINDFQTTTFKLKEEEIPSYEISLSWEYEKDLDYDTKALVTIVKKDKTLYVVQKADLKSQDTN